MMIDIKYLMSILTIFLKLTDKIVNYKKIKEDWMKDIKILTYFIYIYI